MRIFGIYYRYLLIFINHSVCFGPGGVFMVKLGQIVRNYEDGCIVESKIMRNFAVQNAVQSVSLDNWGRIEHSAKDKAKQSKSKSFFSNSDIYVS